jgi:subtilisin family serine protease
MAARAGVKVGYIYKHSIKGFSAQMPASMAERMSADPSVDYYDHDGVAFVSAQIEGVSSDQVESRMQSTPWGITRVGGPADGTNLGKYAFVIDTGIDLDHPDLNVATSLSRSFVPGSSSADDQNGHGTHVAGTIAAINNGFGVVGVAAGARVVSVRVLNAQGSGAFSDIIAGVDYVAQVGLAGEVANLSLGGPRNAPLDNAVRNAAARGIFFVLAAGNESQNANNVSPARANGTNIYTISAHDSQDRFASFSNFGNPPVDCADPGVSILSTWLNGGFNTISGTSMAAPHAAGIFLINNGQAFNGGLVTGDPDGNPDPICVL